MEAVAIAVVVRSNDPYSTARTLATVFPRVLRLGSELYVASTEPLAIEAQNAAEVDPLAMTIEADETTILMATAKARINSDLVANSEYYLTYPFAASIAVQGSDAAAAAKTYVDADPGRFRSYVRSKTPSESTDR